jgi:hypothetical protein
MNRSHGVFLTSYFGFFACEPFSTLFEGKKKEKKRKVIVAYMCKCQTPPQNPY